MIYTLGQIGCMVKELYCRPAPDPTDLTPVLDAVEENNVCLEDLKAREPEACIVQTSDKQLENCKCSNDIVIDGPSLGGGWSNTIGDCSLCGDGDVCAKFKIYQKDAPRSYIMMGLSDSCGVNTTYTDIDYAFYSIIRNDLAIPYWIVYIYENGANRSWFVYDRQLVPDCRDFEIRRVGTNIQYFIDGNLVREVPDTTGGATLCLDNSLHGTLNTGFPVISQQSVCQIIS